MQSVATASASPSSTSRDLLRGDTREAAAARRAQRWLRLLERARELGQVALACEELGVHRTYFYRIWRMYRRGGEEALMQAARRAVDRSPALQAEVERAVLRITALRPDWGRVRVARALREQGYEVSARRVWGVWKRHGLLRPERGPTPSQ